MWQDPDALHISTCFIAILQTHIWQWKCLLLCLLSNYKICVYISTPDVMESFSEPTIFVVVWRDCSQRACILKYLIILCSSTEPLESQDGVNAVFEAFKTAIKCCCLSGVQPPQAHHSPPCYSDHYTDSLLQLMSSLRLRCQPTRAVKSFLPLSKG